MRPSSGERPVAVDNPVPSSNLSTTTTDHKSRSATGGSSGARRGVVAERYEGSSGERPYPLEDPVTEPVDDPGRSDLNPEYTP